MSFFTLTEPAKSAKKPLRWQALLPAIWITLAMAMPVEGQLFKRFTQREPEIPIVFDKTPSKQQLLMALQQNISQVKQLNSTVKISLDGTPKLKGSLQIERPKRMRVKAGLLGISELGVDVGSNDNLFWVWTKANLPNQKPAILYSTHEAFKRSSGAIRQSIPLEPAWLMEGLGLFEFDPTDVHQEPSLTETGHLQLITIRRTPTGPQYKVSLVDPQRAIVVQQTLYNSQRQIIAYTNSTEHKYYPEHRVSLPHKLELYLYQGQQVTKMIVEAGEFEFNSLYGDANKMWSMPNPDGIPKIDLTRISAGIGGPQR